MPEVKHFPAPGQPLTASRLHSISPTCPCEPDKRTVYKNTTSGRGGSHQGRHVLRIEYRHRVIEE
jgi:hypothetical protein